MTIYDDINIIKTLHINQDINTIHKIQKIKKKQQQPYNDYINLNIPLLLKTEFCSIKKNKKIKILQSKYFYYKTKTPFLSYKPFHKDNKSKKSNMQSHSVNNPFILCGLTVKDISNRLYLIKTSSFCNSSFRFNGFFCLRY